MLVCARYINVIDIHWPTMQRSNIVEVKVIMARLPLGSELKNQRETRLEGSKLIQNYFDEYFNFLK